MSEEYDNARQIVVTMRSGTVHTLPGDPSDSTWANEHIDRGWLIVDTEGRQHAFVLRQVLDWKRIG